MGGAMSSFPALANSARSQRTLLLSCETVSRNSSSQYPNGLIKLRSALGEIGEYTSILISWIDGCLPSGSGESGSIWDSSWSLSWTISRKQSKWKRKPARAEETKKAAIITIYSRVHWASSAAPATESSTLIANRSRWAARCSSSPDCMPCRRALSSS